MLASAAMSLSSVCVVSNSLRLNKFKINSKGEYKMKVTLKIEGMMCPHCSGRVQKALEGLEGVISADVSHELGTAVIEVEKEFPEILLKTTVEKEGYKVI